MAFGRPPKLNSEEDWRIFENLCRIHCTEDEICKVLNITRQTLNKHCKERYGSTFLRVYKNLTSEGRASLRRYQWRAAEEGNPTMLIWLGKQVLGQTDKQNVELNADVKSDVTVQNKNKEEIERALKDLKELEHDAEGNPVKKNGTGE